MIIKKYQGRTEAEAVLKAKEELGSTAIVMNVKITRPKGIFGFFRSGVTEVTAALEEPEDVMKETSAIEKRLDSLQSMLERQTATGCETKMEVRSDAVKEEAGEKNEAFHCMQLIYSTMIENEVDEKYANQIIGEIDQNMRSEAELGSILAGIYQKMILKFGEANPITLSDQKPKTVFFIGPTGVGKTTTIAKIASRFCVEEKKKVVLLTADTYRIAAAEQLRTYANILDIPFRVIYTPEELQQAEEDYADYDLILVDTAGHFYKNEDQKGEIKNLLDSMDQEAETEVFLVVSATTKYADLIEITQAYAGMADYKLIFTKTDETAKLGNLLNIKLHSGAEMSYITCGQNVPDDIEQFNGQSIVKQLLGGK